MQFKKQQLEPDMEQQTGSKLGKGYVKNTENNYTKMVLMSWIATMMWSLT